jgi:hypothetical protein
MATAYKSSDKSTRKEAGASALLNDFTDASRSIQHMDGSHFSKNGVSKDGTTSARHDYYEETVKELKIKVGDASRKGELSVKERISIEDRFNRGLEKLSEMPADKFKEALTEFIKKEKGQSYEAAVSRVARLTSDLRELSDSAPDTASYALETAIHDFSTTTKKSSGRKAQDNGKEDQLQIAKDLKTIRKAAIIDELAEKLNNNADSNKQQRERPKLRPDSSYTEAVNRHYGSRANEDSGKQEQKEEREASSEKHETSAEKNGGGGNGSNGSGTRAKRKPEEEQPLVLELEKLDSPEKMIKQRSIMEANMNKRMDEINRVLNNMEDKEKNEITAEDIAEVSDANIKLFIEISAYKDLLMKTKDNLDRVFPDDKEAREAHENSIDALVEKLGDAGSYSNKRIAKLAEEKELNVSKVPMFMHEIRDMQRDIDDIRDSSGKPIYERLGANVLAYNEGDNASRVVKQISDDYEEIMKRLNDKNKAVMRGYENDYPDMSELVITQLAAIGVQLKLEGGNTVQREEVDEAIAPLIFTNEAAE